MSTDRRLKKDLTDEAAILGSGAALGLSTSQYVRLRKNLFKQYTQNAFKVSGKKFSKSGYKRFTRQYLKEINKLRNSPHHAKRTQSYFKDLKHFNPKYITKKSRRLLNRKEQFAELKKLNRASFYRIAPKRVGLMMAGLAGAVAGPALAERYQKKRWGDAGKTAFLHYSAPIVAGLSAYAAYKIRK